MKKTLKMIVLGGFALLLLIQFVPVQRDNPPVTSDVNAPDTVKSIPTALNTLKEWAGPGSSPQP